VSRILSEMSLTRKRRFVKGTQRKRVIIRIDTFDRLRYIGFMKKIVLVVNILFLVSFLTVSCNRKAPSGEDKPNEPKALETSLSPIPTQPPTSTPAPTAVPTLIPAARVKTGDQALFIGDWESAITEYTIAWEASDNTGIKSAALLGLGQAYIQGRNYYVAGNNLDTLINEYPNSPHLAHAYYFLGQVYTRQDRYAESTEAYQKYLDVRPGVADAYILDLLGDAQFAAGSYIDAAQTFQDASNAPSQLDNLLLKMKEARAYVLAGDHPTALALYDDLYASTNNEYTRALIDLRKGQVYTELGEMEKAHESYLDAVYNYPTSYNSYTALIALVDAGVEVDELSRGMVDYYAGQYGVARAAFDRYLQQENPPDPAKAYYYYGLITRDLGGYQEAIEWWERIIENYPENRYWDDAWEQKAYTQWAFMNEYEEAIKTLTDFVERVPAHPRAGEFLYDAAAAAERAGSLEQAAKLWEQVLNTYAGYEKASRAIFLSGITHYRLGNYQSALNSFIRFQGIAITLQERASAQFWIAKSQSALGDEEVAKHSWELTSAIDPTGYYSERARDILNNRPVFDPPQSYDLMIDPELEKARAETWLRSTFGLPEETNLNGLGELSNDPNLLRGAELWALGRYDDAWSEFEALQTRAQSDPALTYKLANYFLSIDAYRPAILSARGVLNQALMDDATTLSAPRYFNQIRFGAYYKDMIIPLAQEYGLHPLFLFSLARQESLFDKTIRSSADARGLMQIIPTTGDEINGNLGWPSDYTNDDLIRPVVNLRFGVDYLNTQRNLFDGDLYAALAAYNGGPGNSLAWKKLVPDDPDLFLEVIRWAETRNYIRGIFEIFAIYRLIYDRTP